MLTNGDVAEALTLFSIILAGHLSWIRMHWRTPGWSRLHATWPFLAMAAYLAFAVPTLLRHWPLLQRLTLT